MTDSMTLTPPRFAARLRLASVLDCAVFASGVASGTVLAEDPPWDVAATGQPSHTANISTTEGTWLSIDVSPDGQHIAFISDKSGADHIWIADASGKNERKISNETASKVTNTDWSAKGEYIVATRATTNLMAGLGTTIGLFHVGGGATQPPYARGMVSVMANESLWDSGFREVARVLKRANDAGVLVNAGRTKFFWELPNYHGIDWNTSFQQDGSSLFSGQPQEHH